MKRALALCGLLFAAATLSGCYYDPGYGYVRRSGYQGDVYYGHSAPVYYDDYYGAPGYYGYYGCCYAPGVDIGIGRTWYGGARYRHYRGGRPRGHAYRGEHRSTYRGNDHRGSGSRPDDRHDGHTHHRDHGHRH